MANNKRIASRRLRRKLAAYSLATGSGLLAVESVDAAVVPFKLDAPINVYATQFPDFVDLDIDGDGNFDYSILGSFNGSTYLGEFRITYSSSQSGYFANFIKPDSSSYFADVLSAGEQIGPASSTGWSTRVEFDSFNGIRGYVGLQFEIPGGSPHFAYLDVGIASAQNQNIPLTIYGGAYESLANTPILAGAVPEPGSLALLAAGAIALGTWRRRENKDAS